MKLMNLTKQFISKSLLKIFTQIFLFQSYIEEINMLKKNSQKFGQIRYLGKK